jgi:ribose transport system ATP-binding protein
MDEPTRGVDVGAKAEIYKIMRQLADRGLAVLMISSEMPEVIGLADRVYVMREGVITGQLEAGEIDEQRIVQLATQKRAS